MKRPVSVLVTLTLLVLAMAAAVPAQAKDKTTICHKPGTPAQKTMKVPDQALPGHLGHGDTTGPCDPLSPPTDDPPDDDDEKVMVCHKPGTPAEKTLEIASEAVQAHLEHGDYRGACTETPSSAEPEPTDSAKITRCHKPGTPAEKTKEVPLQAVDGHLLHGDTLGACDLETLAPVTAGLASASCVWARYVPLPRGPRRPLPC
jgi:hypothetical protein